VRAVVEDPAGCGSLLAHIAEAAMAFRRRKALSTRNGICFVAAWPTAHTLAYLRITVPVTEHGARLTTGLGGLTPDRAGFAPAGRQTKFHDFIASSILSDQPCLATLLVYIRDRWRTRTTLLSALHGHKSTQKHTMSA